ncbi:unnamed protein product [Lactuca saligna]|uniref:FMR1-interacting protein 1 conserved domain-containing protein n=1 Tax=Lactuca saligna TaxID=75948 RepID=A0AA35YY08_LACSI|nr:unnamed protein product [Lactuca saligna]
MNPHHNSNQNPATPSAAQQVNSVTNQQTCNGNVGGLLPNNRPIAPPSCFMNFPNQPFPLQNTMAQFPTGFPGFNPQQNFNPFPVNQFNPCQQQAQFFPNNSMNRPVYNPNVALPNEQVIMQNTIQNIYQLLQLQSQSQNPNYPQCPPGNFPMFQNQIPNLMSHQNPGFLPNQQFSMPNFNGSLQHANQGQQLQGNPFLPHAPNSVQPQQSPNLLLQNQIPQGVVPQNHNFLPNQMNPSGPMQHANQGQKGQQGTSILPQKPSPTVTNFQEKHGNNINGGWTSPHKNFTGDKKNDTSQSHKGFKSQFHHGKHAYNGNMNQEGKNNAAVNSRHKNSISTKFEKKVPSLKYTEQEIKQWREARKKHYPTNVNKSKEEEASVLRRQQLKEILTKQAELGCEVADIPSHYLSGPEKHIQKHEKERFKKGKFQKKRGNKFQNDRITKKTRSENPNKPTENKRDPSLLQKLLTKDIKRDQNHLLQVFRFMVVNSFFSGQPKKPLRFPDVIVRETGAGEVAGEVAGEPDSLVVEGGEKVVEKVDVDSDEEEGEITD